VLTMSDKASGTVLIVDDDADGVEVLKYLLESHGYHVDSAADGREGLQYLQAGRRPDVVILDLAMPVMTGWQFLAARASDDAMSKIPVIVVTASQPQSQARQEPVMIKPVDLDLLLERIDSICHAGPHGPRAH
jgi:CheY-like chemotaxis protein